ncbi:complement component C7-like [Xenia sp. Carnegie-2017]|uniref:complement component C7-like n=1 Tax=Xenia sp. Carnegie-2017 TaxID=2897299 RepID=UPI001F0368EE|nr:complement component C7-like [Xenia sp. Carnegie-2017]
MDGHGEARTNALMKCAEAALDMKMKIFALQNGGECMAEEDGERKYDHFGMSNLCHGDGLGGPYVNEVYRFLGNNVVSRDGFYSDWGDWAPCSVTCGEGVETRIRTCTNPEPSGGGKDCSKFGPASESRKCVSNC